LHPFPKKEDPCTLSQRNKIPILSDEEKFKLPANLFSRRALFNQEGNFWGVPCSIKKATFGARPI
jgi:hypothetical protein